MTEWGAKTKKKGCVRFVASHVQRCTILVSLSLSLSPDSLRRVADCRAYSRLRCLWVSLTHECRQQWIAFFVTLYLCLCLCLCLTRDDLEMRFRAQVHVMYIEADIELSRLHITWQCTCR